jgi:hypothetical protein
MNIDQRIKAELEQESAEIDRILAHDTSMRGMLAGGLKGGLGRWFLIANLAALAVTVFFVWCGYHFFTDAPDQQVFWGVLFLLGVQLQIAIKQWLWQEMQRSTVMREVKRVELAVARLADRLPSAG